MHAGRGVPWAAFVWLKKNKATIITALADVVVVDDDDGEVEIADLMMMVAMLLLLMMMTGWCW